jgi:hypothetical protein
VGQPVDLADIVAGTVSNEARWMTGRFLAFAISYRKDRLFRTTHKLIASVGQE